jgi:membrane protein
MGYFDFNKWRDNAMALWDESGLRSQARLSNLQKFVHFWILVAKSFNRNRLPVRASSMAYATLLALIPMLAVAVSVTSTFLKNEGEERINQFIVQFISSVVPQSMLTTNTSSTKTDWVVTVTNAAHDTSVSGAEMGIVGTGSGSTNGFQAGAAGVATNEIVVPKFLQAEEAVEARKTAAREINRFIQNTRSGTLGVTGSIVLIFVAISMLSRIEATFNDIWGVEQGRNFFLRTILYWGVITLAPLLLVVILGLASGPHLQSTRRFLETMPLMSQVVFSAGPVVILCLAFAAFYALIPNTHVNWGAAMVGGITAGLLLHANNLISALYFSRVVSNSKIYGSLGLVPVFMIGLYFAWLILLFGAQVAYAYQNRATYFEEKQAENINQRGREFVALRIMTIIGQRFAVGEPPPRVGDLASSLAVPSRLICQILRTLTLARLVIESGGTSPAYTPARPLENITCHDILLAMRATQGQELATREGPERTEVYGEFQRIQAAERQAAASVDLRALVSRAQPLLPDQDRPAS